MLLVKTFDETFHNNNLTPIGRTNLYTTAIILLDNAFNIFSVQKCYDCVNLRIFLLDQIIVFGISRCRWYAALEL